MESALDLLLCFFILVSLAPDRRLFMTIADADTVENFLPDFRLSRSSKTYSPKLNVVTAFATAHSREARDTNLVCNNDIYKYMKKVL